MSIWKKIQKALETVSDMKNEKKRGKSMRNGNRPAPYTKYKKRPYVYSFKSRKVGERYEEYKQAAE